jgi:hypothetical protein
MASRGEGRIRLCTLNPDHDSDPRRFIVLEAGPLRDHPTFAPRVVGQG